MSEEIVDYDSLYTYKSDYTISTIKGWYNVHNFVNEDSCLVPTNNSVDQRKGIYIGVKCSNISHNITYLVSVVREGLIDSMSYVIPLSIALNFMIDANEMFFRVVSDACTSIHTAFNVAGWVH
ncbi:hypothetical protein BDB01DRAFT_835853 [Pilobolus umbonatus]|nr:hypothetical protein BDB01DRAFT_835735 [Pilobolus umbonatus]KAI8983078.1 hypothetical protein BDB01DRAFT_835853 [Pilobolus umbonatus]